MINNPFEGKEIWFFTGSQDLYGPEVLDQVAAQSKEIAAQIDGASTVPVKIVWKPVLKDREAIRTAALEANADDACVGVIAWMHTFSPAKMWILGMDALTKPLLQLHTQYAEKLPYATLDMDYMNLNQSAHGDREFGYLLTRLGKTRRIVVGHASHPDTASRIGTWARAATAWNALHHMKLARFGDNMRNVAVTEGDKTEAELRLGVSVNTWSVNDLVEVVDAVEESAIDELVATYDAQYEVAEELRPGGAARESLRYGARIELGLRKFLDDGGFEAFSTNFEDLGGLRQLPGLAVQRLMADGYGFGAEGDWKTAVLVRIAKIMGYGLEGGASLMEDYCYEFTPGKEKILGAHMLEICPSLTGKKPSLEIHPLDIGDREDPVRLGFDADPADGRVVALSDMRERFRLTANIVKIVGPDEPLPNLPVARAVWEPAPSFQASTECWLTSGGAHHTVMTTNTNREMWEDLADIADIELALIDEDTTVRGFAKERLLETAIHRLNGGR